MYQYRNKTQLTSGSSSLRLDAQTARATYPDRYVPWLLKRTLYSTELIKRGNIEWRSLVFGQFQFYFAWVFFTQHQSGNILHVLQWQEYLRFWLYLFRLQYNVLHVNPVGGGKHLNARYIVGRFKHSLHKPRVQLVGFQMTLSHNKSFKVARKRRGPDAAQNTRSAS